jgi:hypothetical protein
MTPKAHERCPAGQAGRLAVKPRAARAFRAYARYDGRA